MEDAKIIELFFQRNEQAVKETDTAYGCRLYLLSSNILNNREDAEESVSDTYMETWNTVCLPWQECKDFENLLEPQRIFELRPSVLHHLYTTHFVTISEP